MEGEGAEKLKSRKQAARAAHRRLSIAQSDALNALSAFVSWLGAQNKEAFCRCNNLNVALVRMLSNVRDCYSAETEFHPVTQDSRV